MGPTCAGKSTIINCFLSLSNKIGAVQIGKMMRAKYGEAHFKGQGAPSHTKDEALQMYFDEVKKLVAEEKEIIIIDGQPRDVDQAQVMIASWPYQSDKYFLVTADHDVREARARKDREPGQNLDLAIARLTNDYKSNYHVMVKLISHNIPIRIVNTSAESFNTETFCRGIIAELES